MTRRRIAWAAGSGVAALALAAAAGVLVVRSPWFAGQVRAGLVKRLETATGGRVELGAFRFDWRRMRVELDSLTLHGLEPAGKPPLLHCESVAVGLRIVSLVERNFDIPYLEVAAPRIYLMADAAGRTNIPQPKTGGGDAVETILKLAIGRFDLARGEMEVESRGTTPFEAHGRGLALRLTYDRAGPRYGGEISLSQLALAGPGATAPAPLALAATVTLERGRLGISRMEVATGASQVSLAGAIEDLASPHGSFRYRGRLTNADAARILQAKLLDRGAADSDGTLTWRGGGDFRMAGSLRASGLEYHDSHVRLSGFTARGSLEATAAGIRLRSLRLAGRAMAAGGDLPVEGTVAEASLRGRELTLDGIALDLLGGAFQGKAMLHDLDRYEVEGEVSGLAARRAVAVYSAQPLPWDALASGGLTLTGSFRRPRELRAHAALEIAPAPGSTPVHGRVEAAYDAESDVLDLGRSVVSLLSSSATVSGAIGRELRVRLETRDLRDLLPVLGESAAEVPVALAGSAVFSGAVIGKFADPRISGTVTAGPFTFQGRSFDGFEAGVTASSENLRLANARLIRHGWGAGFELAVALKRWKAEDSGAVFGTAAFRNVPAADVAALAGHAVPVTGTLAGTAQLTGTVANPLLEGEVALARGSYRGEPFDSLTGHVAYSNRSLSLAGGQVAAGAKHAQVSAAFAHQPGDFSRGRVQFQVATNAMPLQEIHWLQERRPEIRGTVEVTARGAFQMPFRVDALEADISALGLALNGAPSGTPPAGPGGATPLGDLRLTAKSQGAVLEAHLESVFASTSIQGDGQWRLEGDWPGSATVRFSRVDLATLRERFLPASGAAGDFSGFTEGSLALQGPALKPEAMEGELRLPAFEITAASAGLTLRNSGPVVARFAGSAVTVQSARLTGRNTDLSVTGKASLAGTRAVDARVAGRIDLAIVHDWNPDFTASGTLEADAQVRGSLESPQIGGRVQFQKAGFNIAGVVNGISNAAGVVTFSGGRASIQSFSGETGGGRIRLAGFAAYGGGSPIFRLHAAAEDVRVRYPEGVSTMVNANLNFTGSADRSMLAGSITILRTSISAQSDFSSLVAQSAEPVRAPLARTGLLGGLNFDINVQTSPDVQVSSALTQDVQLEANLHLRGTVSAPALLGRINITGGQVMFFGTRYRIGQGSISFFNPLAVDPVLDVDLETKSRGVEVTLTVSGPLNKLGLSYRSDPPLQFSEIVALLATGRTPTSDAALMSSENPAAQPFQQMGASALLGQAISSPVTGRLQRFFGVSQLRIDPTLPGVEYNPQARLTLQQQVTQNITFTYITDVTSTNPQVVSVEWAFAKQWSAVAERQENGMIGMDIIFKKRF